MPASLNLNSEEVIAYNAQSSSSMGAGIPHVLNEPLVHSTGNSGRTLVWHRRSSHPLQA